MSPDDVVDCVICGIRLRRRRSWLVVDFRLPSANSDGACWDRDACMDRFLDRVNEFKRYRDGRELAERFAHQEQTRRGAVEELLDDL